MSWVWYGLGLVWIGFRMGWVWYGLGLVWVGFCLVRVWYGLGLVWVGFGMGWVWYVTDSDAEILNGDMDDDGVGAATEPHNVPISSHVLVRPLATRGQAQEPCSFIIPVKTWFNGTRNSSPFE